MGNESDANLTSGKNQPECKKRDPAPLVNATRGCKVRDPSPILERGKNRVLNLKTIGFVSRERKETNRPKRRLRYVRFGKLPSLITIRIVP